MRRGRFILESSAQEIADIYRKRWAVELLFRWLKGHLHVRRFAVKNRNAMKTQMAIAMMVQLLIQLYRIQNKFTGTLWDCLRDLRVNLAKHGLGVSGLRDYDRWKVAPSTRVTN